MLLRSLLSRVPTVRYLLLKSIFPLFYSTIDSETEIKRKLRLLTWKMEVNILEAKKPRNPFALWSWTWENAFFCLRRCWKREAKEEISVEVASLARNVATKENIFFVDITTIINKSSTFLKARFALAFFLSWFYLLKIYTNSGLFLYVWNHFYGSKKFHIKSWI